MTKDAPEQKRMRGVIRLLATRSQRCAAVVRLLSDDRAAATSLQPPPFLARQGWPRDPRSGL